jgi:hypothetical protein
VDVSAALGPCLALLLAEPSVGLVGPAGPRLPAANVAEDCQWPTVVSFRAGAEKCTGTLVHPEIVVTASHCILAGTPERMRFGEEFSPESRTMDVAECWTRPEYEVALDPAEDIAACRLVEPVPDVPITALLGACETEATIVPGVDVALVGFGLTGTGEDFGTKRYAFTRVVEPLREDGTFVAGDDAVNGCDGDSGGPALVRLSDGTWHVAGVLVYGPDCGAGPSRYLAASRHLAWLEEATGRDLSPCRGADGTWQPGPDCRVATDPQAIADAWDAWCDGPRAVPDGACVEADGDAGDTGTGESDGGRVDATTGPDDPSATSAPSEDPDLPVSREGCRIAAARSGPDRTALGPWALAWVAIARRRRVETRR